MRAPNEEYQALLDAARRAIAAQEPAAAIRDLEAALAQDPDRLEARELLGALLCQGGDVDRGIALLESVVDEHPLLVPAHFNLAAAYHQRGRLVDAHHHLEVALRLDPHYERALAAQEAWSQDFLEESIEPAPDQRTAEPGSLVSEVTEDGSRGPETENPYTQNPNTQNPNTQNPSTENPNTGEAVDTLSEQSGPPETVAAAIAAAESEPSGVDRDLAIVAEASHPGVPAGGDHSPESPGPAGSGLGGSEVEKTIALDATGAPASASDPEAATSLPGPLPDPLPAPPAATEALPAGGAGGQHGKPPEPPIPEWLVVKETSASWFEVLSGFWLRPTETLQATWPEFAAAPTASTQVGIVFVAAALLWAGCWAFDPGGSGSFSAGSALLTLLTGFSGAAVLIAIETAAFSLVVCTDLAFPDRVRQVLPPFALAWASANIAVLIPGVILVAAHLVSALLFVTIGMIWSFVLTLVVATTLWRVEFGKTFVLLFAAQIVGNAAAVLLVSAVR